jgi:hypothetical protein
MATKSRSAVGRAGEHGTGIPAAPGDALEKAREQNVPDVPSESCSEVRWRSQSTQFLYRMGHHQISRSSEASDTDVTDVSDASDRSEARR